MKKKLGKAKKVKESPHTFNTEKSEVHHKQDDPRNPFNKKFPEDGMSEPVSQPVPEQHESDSEDMPESEVEGMIQRKEEKKAEAKKAVERSVDTQEWTKADPVIPEEMEDRVWIAVYKCPQGHKTKATNRQAESGIRCYECKEKAAIVPLFLKKPVQEDKRK